MKRRIIKPADVAALACRWGAIGEVAKKLGGTDLAVAEGAVHELAHAAVMGIRPSSSLGADVAARFKRYTSKVAADRSECAALAVERTAFETLGWVVDHGMVVRLACDDMRKMNSKRVAAEVSAQLGRRLNAERAGQVIAWMCEFTGTRLPA